MSGIDFDDEIFPMPSESDAIIVQLAPVPAIYALIPAKTRTVRAHLPAGGEVRTINVKAPRLAWRLALSGDEEGEEGDRIELRALTSGATRCGHYMPANVFDDGSICWGHDAEPATLKAAHNRFWSAPFNADLWPDAKDHTDNGCPSGGGSVEHECSGGCDVDHECVGDDAHEHACKLKRRDDGERCEREAHAYRWTAPDVNETTWASVDPSPESLEYSRKRYAEVVRDGRVHLETGAARLAGIAAGLAPEGWDPAAGCWCAHCRETCACSTGCGCCDETCECMRCACDDGTCDCRADCDCCAGTCGCSRKECNCGLAERFAAHLAEYRPTCDKRAARWMEGSAHVPGVGSVVLITTKPERLAAHAAHVKDIKSPDGMVRYLVAFGQRLPDGSHAFDVGGATLTVPAPRKPRTPINGRGAVLRVGDRVRALRDWPSETWLAGEIRTVVSCDAERATTSAGPRFSIAGCSVALYLSRNDFERVDEDAPAAPVAEQERGGF